MRVNTDELQRQADELQAVASRMNDIQDSVLRIARNLGREQFGERFRYPLNSAAASVGKRSEELRRMRSALQQISRLYERTETGIVEEAEHASVHHQQNGIGSISIPDIQGIINDAVNIVGPGGVPSWVGPRLDWIRVSPVVPIGVTNILRELIERNREQERLRSVMDETLDAMERVFRDQYGPQWISEGSAERLRMRAILDEMMETVREGVTPDIDSVAEDVARAVRDVISERIPSLNEQRTDPFISGFPEEIVDAIQDVLHGDGESGFIPPPDPNDYIINPPEIPAGPAIPEGFVDAIQDVIYNDGESGYIPPNFPTEDIHVIDPTDVFDNVDIPDGMADVIQDAIRNNGNSGYVPPHIHTEDIPAIDPSAVFNRMEGSMTASLDPTGPSLATDQIINSIDIDAGISNLADDVPTMGEAIAGGIGAIDWTPWNP